jgi:hypothetical protein
MTQENKKKSSAALMVLGLLLMIVTTASAKAGPIEDDKLVADWKGVMEVNHRQMHMLFKVRKKNDGYQVTLDSLDEGVKGIPAKLESAEDGKLHIAIPMAQAHFKGTFSEDKDTINGNWEQAGMSIPLNLVRQDEMVDDEAENANVTPLPADLAATLAGNWQGSLSVQGMNLRLLFKITDPGDHVLDGKLDSLDQPARDVPFTVSQDGSKIVFEVKLLKGDFKGELSEDKKTIDGTWTQMGMALPLKISKK